MKKSNASRVLNKNKTIWVGGYETFTRLVREDEKEYRLTMYHNQAFKFDL